MTKNIQQVLWTIMIMIPSLVMAQPPEEEVAPTAPEFNIEITEAPAPEPDAPATQASQIQPSLPTAPIVPPVTAEAAPAEDNSVKGITLSPAITLKPLGYNGERDQTFFEISPSVGLESAFKTSQKRDVGLSATYAFIWDEFLSNRAAALRYFEHDISGGATTQWSDIFSTALKGGFNYSLWASESREHAIFSEDFIEGKFSINKAVSVVLAYRLFFFNDLDTQFRLSDGTFPGDGDDIRGGNAAISGSDPLYYDPFSTTFNYDPVVGNVWFANNGLQLKTKFIPVEGTTLTAEYEYTFLTFTNTADTDWHGHWIVASVSQALPWKGGSVSLKNQLRLRNYQSKTNDDGNLSANLRNRVTFTLGQSITDSISTELWYRWEMSGSNADNYDILKNQHQINLGFTFAF